MEKQPNNDERIGGVKKSYVRGCLIGVGVFFALLLLMFLLGYMG